MGVSEVYPAKILPEAFFSNSESWHTKCILLPFFFRDMANFWSWGCRNRHCKPAKQNFIQQESKLKYARLEKGSTYGSQRVNARLPFTSIMTSHRACSYEPANRGSSLSEISPNPQFPYKMSFLFIWESMLAR